MPNIECRIDSISQEITNKTVEGQAWFTTIDLKYAYSQIPLHPDTAKHLNFNLVSGESTGTYRFLTGFYGLTEMPAKFQKALDSTLVGLSNTCCFLDDTIIVSRGSQSEHLDLVYKYLKKLDQENFAINLKKCHFLKSEIICLGHHITQTGIRPTISKTSALSKLKRPRNAKQLKSFLVSVHHVTKFVPN